MANKYKNLSNTLDKKLSSNDILEAIAENFGKRSAEQELMSPEERQQQIMEMVIGASTSGIGDVGKKALSGVGEKALAKLRNTRKIANRESAALATQLGAKGIEQRNMYRKFKERTK